MNKSQTLLGDEYWFIYNSAIDTINSWIYNKIGNFAYWKSIINYRIDSVLCINNQRNKVIASIMLPYLDTIGTSDQIKYLYGVKINDQWYFYSGATLVLPRENYQDDIHTPLSFEKLKQIATVNIYRGYLKKDKKGIWQINERFFDQVVPYTNLKVGNKLRTEEEYVRFMIDVNWSSDKNETIRKYHED